jgi:uracil phosphoribosyltransferase
MTADVQVIGHPLVQHKLTLLRKKSTSTVEFRRLLGELSALMAYEVTRDLPMREVAIETPVGAATGHLVDGKRRHAQRGAGSSCGTCRLVSRRENVAPGRVLPAPAARHARPRCDCRRPDARHRQLGIAALDRVKAARPRSLRFVCLVSCPEGLANLRDKHPDVPVLTAAIDERLIDRGYIVPGLGDAGDRHFGTRA